MSSQIINITHKLVDQKLDEIIKSPRSTYDPDFFDAQLRQRVIVRVLNRTSPRYTLHQESEMDQHANDQSSIPAQEEAQIEDLIQQTLVQILREESDFKYLSRHPQPVIPQEPSHWFG